MKKKKKSEEVCDQLEETRQECNQLRDKHLRLCADFDNARKRWERERGQLLKFANFTLLRELIVVIDEMEQALKVARNHSDMEAVVKGLEMTYKNFMGILNKTGLTMIEAAGKAFDPHLHEIAASREVDQTQDHLVLEEVQRGYLYEGKLLRTAKVIVGVAKQMTDDRPQTTEGEEEDNKEEEN